MKGKEAGQKAIRTSRFPIAIFFVFLLTLLLMSGVHIGIITLANEEQWPTAVQILLPTLYWGLVAVGLTLFTRWEIRRNYEEPMRNLRNATEKVANGDFSVYVPPLHSVGKLDYLDAMILDFNKMVEELGSIEVLKTDFFSNVFHEIKTPLAVIHNNAQLLQRANLEESQRKECADAILHATRRLSNLITNMLKLNKLEKQAIQPAPQSFDLCAQLSECALHGPAGADLPRRLLRRRRAGRAPVVPAGVHRSVPAGRGRRLPGQGGPEDGEPAGGRRHHGDFHPV